MCNHRYGEFLQDVHLKIDRMSLTRCQRWSGNFKFSDIFRMELLYALCFVLFTLWMGEKRRGWFITIFEKRNLFLDGPQHWCDYKWINSMMYHCLINKNIIIGKLLCYKWNKTHENLLLSEMNQVCSSNN